MKPVIVLSGVNLRELGPLAIFRDALESLVMFSRERYQLVALVHRQRLFETEGVTYLEYPEIATSWLARVNFEYRTARIISKQLKPLLWLSMHDMTPNVMAGIRAVYCHNAAAFYRPRAVEWYFDPTVGLFSLFYRYLYRINIRKNAFVVVQQDSLRREFRRAFGISNVVVAHPVETDATVHSPPVPKEPSGPYRFFYPAPPRVFKNPEVCLEATRILEKSGFRNFEVWLTFDSTTNRFATRVVQQFADVMAVRWLGVVSRKRVFELYAEADCLLFLSRLETWGLPISEFRRFGKPMLLADKPYAHETAAGSEHVRFFDESDPEKLAEWMMRAAMGEPIFHPVTEIAIEEPYARDWDELWWMLLRAPQLAGRASRDCFPNQGSGDSNRSTPPKTGMGRAAAPIIR